MKKSIYIVWMLVSMFITGCIDDRGNYDYQPLDKVWPVTISGISAQERTIGDRVQISPTIKGTEGLTDLKYTWFLYTRGLAISQEDTLSHAKELDWVVNRESGNYYLMFEVRDTVRDLFTKRYVNFNISTSFSTGWYVLETDGIGSDMDMIRPDGTTVENLLTTYGSERMEGGPRKIVFKEDHRHEVENASGTVEVKKIDAFILLSERDIRVYDAQTMALLKRREDCFYEMPASINPLNRFVNGSADDQLNNDGQYYMFNSGNVGKFGYPVLGADGTNNYRVHPDAVSASQKAFLWDELSRSFLYLSLGSQMTYLSEASAEDRNYGPVSNTDKEMIRMLFRSQTKVQAPDWKARYLAYGLWKDSKGEYSIVDLYFDAGNYPIVGSYALPEGNRLSSTDIMVAHQTMPTIFFESNGNELWEHTVSSATALAERERKVYNFPVGEEIVCIRHLDISISAVEEKMDRLVVLTNSVDGWKLYGFDFIEGTVEFDMTVTPEKALIGQGKGKGGYVMRMDNYRDF